MRKRGSSHLNVTLAWRKAQSAAATIAEQEQEQEQAGVSGGAED